MPELTCETAKSLQEIIRVIKSEFPNEEIAAQIISSIISIKYET